MKYLPKNLSVYFGMFIQFQTTMTKILFELTIHQPAEGLDDVVLFWST